MTHFLKSGIPLIPWRRLIILTAIILSAMPLIAQRRMIRAVDQLSGMGIANAELIFPGAGLRGKSDASGWIQIDTPLEGVFETILTADGYGSRRFRLKFSTDTPSFRQEFFLNPLVVNLEAFTVEGALTDGDRDALAKRESVAPVDQVSGDALQDVTDDGLGDTLEKISGVTVETDGESVTGINIRGAGPRQTRVTVDGQSVAGGGGRGTTRGIRAMGQIPREFINRIQVMKAPTPDMDADAIGGSVDLQTSRVASSKKARSSISLRSGWQEESATWGHRINFAHAEPVKLGGSGSRLGILLAANAQTNENAPDMLRVQNQWPERISPETGEPVQTLARLRMGTRHTKNRGYGVVLNTDLQLNENSHFYLKGMWNERQSDLSMEFHTIQFIQGKILSLLPDYGKFKNIRLEKQFLERSPKDTSGSLVFGGEQILGDWTIDESIGYSFAQSDSTGTLNAVFSTNKVYDGSYDISGNAFRPQIRIETDGVESTNTSLLDPVPYAFRRIDHIDDHADDSEIALRVNVTRRIKRDASDWTLKSGLKARLREAENNQDKVKYFPTNNSLTLETFASPGEVSIYRNRYPLGPSWSASSMEDRFRTEPDTFEFNPLDKLMDSAASDFSVSESIYAAYGMIQRESKHWIIIAGLRLERTDSRTRGFQTVSEVDENRERVVEVTPVSISGQYDMFLPGLHALYRPTSNWIIRGSLTRTLQRPDFRDQSPSARVDLDRRRIRAGNPELDPFDAKAVDLGTDFFSNKWGSMSFALFYKRIDDFIVDTEQETDYLGEPGFILSHPVNGSPADLYGLEASWATSLTFLPDPFAGTEFTANYVLTDSTAAYPFYPGENIMLPKQVEQTLNLSLRWRFQNWSIAYRARYRGEQLNNLIRPGQDQYNSPFWTHSISLNYKINNTVNLSVGIANLNKPDRTSYQGSSLRMLGNFEGTRRVSIGLNVKFGSSLLDRILDRHSIQ